jgi:replicative superfamily II helicase
VIYVCPIKALLNNLEQRLSHYAGLVGRRVAVWHGDVSQTHKNHAIKDAPDILLTTPESLEGMLVSTRIDRFAWFGNLRVVIADELHAFAADDRGWHLRAVLHRLQQYVPHEVQRIGLSATVSNPVELLDWFAPTGIKQVVGSASVSTDADVTIDYVGSLANAATVIARLYQGSKRLVFCDSRSSAEQLTSTLRAQEVRVFLSHASLSSSERKLAETAFAEEKDCVIVATTSSRSMRLRRCHRFFSAWAAPVAAQVDAAVACFCVRMTMRSCWPWVYVSSGERVGLRLPIPRRNPGPSWRSKPWPRCWNDLSGRSMIFCACCVRHSLSRTHKASLS